MQKKEPFLLKFIIVGSLIIIFGVIISVTLFLVFKDTYLGKIFSYMFLLFGYSFLGLIIVAVIGSVFFPSISSYYESNLEDSKNVPYEFEKIYEYLYENYLVPLNGKRKMERIIRNFMKIILIIFVGALIVVNSNIFYMLPKTELRIKTLSSIIFFFGAIIVAIKPELLRKDKEIYTKKYKNDVVSNLIKFLNNKLNYLECDSQKAEKYQRYYEKSMFNKTIYAVYTEDYIEGFLPNNYFIEMSNLRVKESPSRRNGDSTVFDGIFSYINSNENINTHIRILQKSYRSYKCNLNKIEMNDEIFEKYFEIYAENEWLAKKMITKDFSRKLVYIREKYNVDFEIVFNQNNIYLRFFTFATFEPTLSNSKLKEKSNLFTQYLILKLIFDVSNEVIVALNEYIKY